MQEINVKEVFVVATGHHLLFESHFTGEEQDPDDLGKEFQFNTIFLRIIFDYCQRVGPVLIGFGIISPSSKD